MDRATLANEAVNAALKTAPIPGFLLIGSVSPVLVVQLALYGIGIVYGVMQIRHLRWIWRNEREDRARKIKDRPRTPPRRDVEMPEVSAP